MLEQRYAIVVYSQSSAGHRAEYNRVLSSNFDASIICGSLNATRLLQAIKCRQFLFFSMIEENTIAYFMISIIRWMIGQKTGGFLFRPKQCLAINTLSRKIKFIMLRFLTMYRISNTIVLLPFDIEHGMSVISNDWIYDMQLWDAELLFGDTWRNRAVLKSDLKKAILEAASGRKILISLGEQSQEKGFDLLSSIWCRSEEIRRKWLFVAAGRVARDSESRCSEFVKNGGIAINRYIEEYEMIALYGCSDAAWACYAPSYNQASGIFGRAFQAGLPIVIRRGSLLEALSKNIDAEVIPLEYGDPSSCVDAFLIPDIDVTDADREQKVRTLGMQSIKTLSGAFFADRSKF